MVAHDADPRGIDTAAVARWLSEAVPGAVDGPLRATLLTGGKSNLTYTITPATGRDLVLRRPPLGHVLATAHDMAREHRVMRALAGSSVPVPQMVALCEDDDVLGAPFYVMAKVDGTAYNRAAQLAPLGAARTRAISERMVDTLVDLHAVDHEAVGLTGFGRPEGYVARQVARWKAQLASSRSRPLPGIDELVTRLEATVPGRSDATIVHGDYRLDNLLVRDDRVVAVLDWEMSTLGDPLADLAVLLAYHQLAETAPDAGDVLVTDAPLAPGHLTRREIVERYAAASGRDVSALDFHLSLAFFKLAVILEGIHLRHAHGQTVGTGFDGIGDMIGPLIEAGLSASR